MNTRIPYGHILFSLLLALAAVVVGMALLSIEPSGAASAFASDGIIGVDAANISLG